MTKPSGFSTSVSTPVPGSAPADKQARQRALDTQGSFVVSAPAGSGKTELLIQRILKLLGQVEQPENILAITFTRKAAREMRERIVSALEDAYTDTPAKSSHQTQTRELANAVLRCDAERGWELLKNPGRLRILTIDAFCRQLANQLCLDSGFSLPPQLAEDSEEAYRLAAEQMLSYLEQDSTQGKAMRLLADHLDGNLEEICSLFANLLGSRDSWLPLAMSQELVDPDYLKTRVQLLVEETLDQTATELLSLQSDLEALLDYALANAKANPDETTWLDQELPAEIPPTDASQLASWRAVCGFLTTANGTFRKSADKRLGFPGAKQSEHGKLADARKQQYKALTLQLGEDENLLRLINRVRVLPDPAGQASSNKINSALLQLLPTLAAEYTVLSQERGETDYLAVTMAALRALGDADNPTPLALRLDYRINHILVDEFQDTAATQVRLLESLTAGWQPEDGRTLFVVGDGMQSIYSFRKADVSLFMRARQFGIGDIALEPADLTANFRSEAQIVDWVNQTFHQIFPEQDDLSGGQVGFRQADIVQSCSSWPITTRGFDSDAAEAAAIATDISAKLKDTEDSMAILVRGRTHLASILPALRAQGIHWQAQDIDPLAERMAVMDIHSLTRALCIPADRIAWLSILRAPWAGLDHADLYHLCQWQSVDDQDSIENTDGKPGWPAVWVAIQSAQSIEAISDAGKLILTRVQRYLGIALDNLGRSPLRDLIECTWQALEGQSGLLHAQDRQDVNDYLDLLERSEQGGIIPDWPAFERRLKKLFAQPSYSSNSTNVATDSLDERVQIMTIHKSKGLEFDHVYLPSMGRRQRSNDNPLLLWWEREFDDGSDGYLLSTKPARGGEDDLYNYLKIEQNAREQHERARLLYVACTRAKKSLFLSATLKFDEEKDKIKKPDSGSMLSLLWDGMESNFCEQFVQASTAGNSAIKSLSVIRRLDPQRPITDPPKTEIHRSPAELEVPSRFSNNFLQRLLGNILHDSLMRIVKEARQPGPEPHIEHWQRMLANSGLGDEASKQLLATLTQCLQKIAADDVGQWLLDPKHLESEAELELDYFDSQGRIQRAIIDRTFVADGTRWIIDYKSSVPGKGEPPEHFLAREIETYRAQLRRYESLFDNTRPVRCMLYFPAAGLHTEL